MSVFDYLSVITSIILGLGLTHVISNFSSIVKAESTEKERYSPLYFLWLIAFLMLYVIYWWAYWDYHSVTRWSFSDFLMIIFGPIGLYIVTDIFTMEKEDTAKNSNEHFERNRKSFFGLFIVLQIWGILIRPFIRDGFLTTNFFGIYKYCQYFVICLFIMGFLSKGRFTQYAVVGLFIGEMIFVITLRYILNTD